MSSEQAPEERSIDQQHPNEGPEPKTLSEWAVVCNHAMEINGFNDTTGRLLTPDDPVARIAALAPIKLQAAEVVEAIRKPQKLSLGRAVFGLLWQVILLRLFGIRWFTKRYLVAVGELGKPVHGSWTQVVHRLVLTDTETAEAIEACHKHDVPNLGEEIIDAIYRLFNLTGHWNDTHPKQRMILDYILRWKHSVNLKRGHRHGGKQA